MVRVMWGATAGSYYWWILLLNIFVGSRRIWLLEVGYLLRNSCEKHVKGCAVCNRQKRGVE